MDRESQMPDAGRVEVAGPSPIRLGQPGTWRVTFRLGPHTRVTAGGEIRFSIERAFAPPQIDDPAAPGYTTARADRANVRLELIRGKTFGDILDEVGFREATDRIESDFALRRHVSYNRGVNLHAVVRAGELAPGDVVTLTYGDASGGPAGAGVMRELQLQDRVAFDVGLDPDGSAKAPYSGFFQVDRAWVPVAAGPAARLLVAAPSVVGVGETFGLVLSVFDANRLLCRDLAGEFRIEAESNGLEILQPRATMEPSAGGHLVLEATARAKKPGIHGLRIHGPDGLSGRTDVILARAHGLIGQRVFWGDIHLHGKYSDGPSAVGPGDYYRLARDVFGLDFAAVTEHDSELVYYLCEQAWADCQQAARAFNQSGRFVTLLGYEYSERRADGDRNVYFRRDHAPVFLSCDPQSDTPEKLWQCLEPYEAMTIPHHPVSNWIGSKLDRTNERFERLIEIFSCWGSSEGPGCLRPVTNRKLHTNDYETKSVFAGLSKGHHYGIIASGDTHDGRAGEHGKAAVLCNELTRDAVWDALYNRRCYATTGPRILLDFSMGGEPMGSQLSCRKGELVNVAGEVIANAPVRSLALIRDGEVIAEQSGREHVTLEDKVAARPGSWHVLRAVQDDDEIAWSSPIWT